ncbi:hypothetical protein [Cystobacter fuscus]|uniref:hypothetical protein n=1 Tax=Cystobacter fuscus TaxID=43 RepID=UPI0037BF1E54
MCLEQPGEVLEALQAVHVRQAQARLHRTAARLGHEVELAAQQLGEAPLLVGRGVRQPAHVQDDDGQPLLAVAEALAPHAPQGRPGRQRLVLEQRGRHLVHHAVRAQVHLQQRIRRVAGQVLAGLALPVHVQADELRLAAARGAEHHHGG